MKEIYQLQINVDSSIISLNICVTSNAVRPLQSSRTTHLSTQSPGAETKQYADQAKTVVPSTGIRQVAE
jgi:hypothetical protein